MEKVITPGAGALTHTACVFHEFCMGFAHTHSAAICLWVSLSRISKINMFHPSSAKTHTLMRDAALLARFSAVRHTAFPSGARQTLTLFIFGLLHGLTGRPPFLQLRRGDEASSARGNVLAGLPPVVIILTYNLQSNSHQFSLVQFRHKIPGG